MSPITLESIQALDKSDLHVHLDGALQRADLIRIAKEHGVVLEDGKLKHYPDAGPFDADRDFEEFKRFLGCFDLVKAIMQTSEGIYEATESVLRQLGGEGIGYAELRMAPTYHTKGGLSLEEVVANTLEAMAHMEMEGGPQSRLVLAIPREIAYTGDESGNDYTADDIVAVARNFIGHGVVGIDLACAEHFDPDPYFAAYQSTFGIDGFKRYVHAGEAGPKRASNVITAVRDMKADVIGHALPLGVDPSLDFLFDELRERRVRIERCPLSNKAMSVSDGNLDGLERLLNEGLDVAICSDDPGIFGVETNLNHNLFYVAQKLNLKRWELEDLVNGVRRGSF